MPMPVNPYLVAAGNTFGNYQNQMEELQKRLVEIEKGKVNTHSVGNNGTIEKKEESPQPTVVLTDALAIMMISSQSPAMGTLIRSMPDSTKSFIRWAEFVVDNDAQEYIKKIFETKNISDLPETIDKSITKKINFVEFLEDAPSVRWLRELVGKLSKPTTATSQNTQKQKTKQQEKVEEA